MSSVTVTRHIAAPVEQVWQVISDIENAPQILSAVESVQRLESDDGFDDDGEGFVVGARWLETRTMMGKQATELMEITAIDFRRSYTVEADTNGVHYISHVTLAPAAGGSRLTMSFEGTPEGRMASFLARITGPLFRAATRKAMTRDLDDIAAAAESAA